MLQTNQNKQGADVIETELQKSYSLKTVPFNDGESESVVGPEIFQSQDQLSPTNCDNRMFAG